MDINKLDIFYVIDTETTGFSTNNGDAIQISAIKVKNKGNKYVILDEFDSYINPEYPLPPSIVEFNKRENTGITDELLSKAPLGKDVCAKLQEFLGESPVTVFHNASFDCKFINKLYVNNGNQEFKPAEIIDTLKICRDKIKGKSHKLGIMFELSDKTYSSNNPKYHTALADAYATLDVLDYLNKTFYKTATKEKSNEKKKNEYER